MRPCRVGFVRVAFTISVLWIGTAARALEIVNLGTAPSGTYSYAYGVSNDRIVTGEADFGFSPSPFRYAAGTMTNLGYLVNDDYGQGEGISHDGSVIVGFTGNASGTRGFRYSGNTMTALNPLAGDAGTRANGVSGDGTVAVGMSYATTPDGQHRAVRWNGSTPAALGQLATGFSSEARSASIDGSTIVGSAGTAGGDMPFVWTAGTGMTALTLAQGFVSGSAEGVSSDGSRIVGYTVEQSSGNERATLWSAGSPLTLAALNANPSFAFGISADGSLAVGNTGLASSSFATVWNAGTGLGYDLRTVLQQQGATGIGSWTSLTAATAISGNSVTGYNIVGWGVAGGAERAFMVTGVMFVPEPCSYLLGAISACMLFCAANRRQRLAAHS